MAYIKQTIIVGLKNNKVNCVIMRGHWSLDSAKSNAEKRGVKLEKIEHYTLDTSGRGRGGIDKVLFEVK